MSKSSGKQNVKVYCRVRPAISKDEESDLREQGLSMGLVPEDHQVLMRRVPGEQHKGEVMFTYDGVFPPQARQDYVFKEAAAPLVAEIFDGFNCTIFAYGQTGSGKTFTMMGALGTPKRGIVPRLVEQIFLGIENADVNVEFTLKVSFVEIYMERIRDLLNPRKSNLAIRENQTGEVYIQDVTEIYVNSYDQVLDVMERGNAARVVATTSMNEVSSRSHSVFSLTLGQRDKNTGSVKSSKLYLVDLAGSEKVRKSEARGHTLEEAKHINRSLSALGNVIYSLTEASQHVPYRDSKLTRLLNDSLGGNSKTSLIITCAPGMWNCDETLSTLRFGARAKRIKNKPKVNQEKSVAEYEAMLREAAKTVQQQAEMIRSLEAEVLRLRAAVLRLSPGWDPNDPEMRRREADILRELAGVESGGTRVVGSLQHKVDELETGRRQADEAFQKLRDRLMETESELDIQQQLMSERQEEVAALKVDVAVQKERAARYEEKVTEYSVFRKKVELMEQEYIIQLDELEVENADLTEKLHALLLNEIESRAAQALRARRRHETRPKRQSIQLQARKDARDESSGRKQDGSGGGGGGSSSSSSSLAAPSSAAPRSDEMVRSPRVPGPAPVLPGQEDRVKQLEFELKRATKELGRVQNDCAVAMTALEKLRAGTGGGAAVDQAVALSAAGRENAELLEQVSKLRRQNETQERLLQNRQQHVDVLELALQEASTMHKRLEAENKATIADLTERLKAAEKMFEDLYNGDFEEYTRERGASEHFVVPVRGGSRTTTPATSARREKA